MNAMNAKIPHLLMALLVGACVAGPLQAQEKVMSEAQVTEQGLIEALTPRPGDGAPSRSFRPGVAGAAAAAAAVAPPARAGILVTFVINSAELTAGARQALDVLAAAMKSEKLAKVHFTIEGHADPRGSDELNLRLSQARADSVRAYLMASHGLNAQRVDAVGKGSTALLKPADPTAPENRRVSIVARPG